MSKKIDISLRWSGKGIKEKGIDNDTGKVIIDLDEKYLRPSEVDFLKGDFSKARRHLKWSPKISTDQLIEDMISEELSGS